MQTWGIANTPVLATQIAGIYQLAVVVWQARSLRLSENWCACEVATCPTTMGKEERSTMAHKERCNTLVGVRHMIVISNSCHHLIYCTSEGQMGDGIGGGRNCHSRGAPLSTPTMGQHVAFSPAKLNIGDQKKTTIPSTNPPFEAL